jgi:phytoene dehydrogenase-like protein
MGAIPLADQEPLYVRIGHASGGRHHGRAGAFGGTGNPERRCGLMPVHKSAGDTRDVVIVGGGHNGLVTAFYLAKAGFKPLVLERRAQVGGAAITEEFHPGFRCSTLAHNAGPLRADIVRDMQLEKHGLKLTTPDVNTVSLLPDGRALVLYSDAKQAAEEIAKWSQKDAASYADFGAALGKIGRVIGEALALTPPNIDSPSSGDLWGMLKTGRSIRNLGKKDLYRVLRWGPMAAADLVAEFFDTEPLRATIAARGIFGTFLGPWSAGSALVLLLRAAADPSPAGSIQFPAGGIGAITQAMAAAAKQAGAEIRTDAEIAEIRVKDGIATGVVLASGEEISARAVVSNADPKRTLMRLVDPAHLSPDFIQKIKNYRCMGTVAKVNLALSALPEFAALKGKGDGLLRGRVQISPEIDYLERAFDESKYGNFSRQPYLEMTLPSLADASLAPAGQHVMSVYMQYAPYTLKNSDWESQRKALGETVVKTIAQYAPNLPQIILRHQIITPKDLEETYGLTGGHIFHGELALDQFFTMRPLLDWARYRTPIERLYLCGSGTHPGTGLTGGSGANAAREIAKALKK